MSSKDIEELEHCRVVNDDDSIVGGGLCHWGGSAREDIRTPPGRVLIRGLG